MPSETPTEVQDATGGQEGSIPPLQLGVPTGPLLQLAEHLTAWQHFVFQTAHTAGSNRVGIADVAHDIQVAAYELRVLLGQGELEAKLGAGMLLSPEDEQKIKQADEAERRRMSVQHFQSGLNDHYQEPLG